MAAARTPVDIGAVLGDRYRLVAHIGTGTSARVYLAVDPVLQRRVAVKVLHEALAGDQRFLERFRQESRMVAALQHDHIVSVLDSGEDGTEAVVVPYLVTEYLDGGSLAAMLDEGRRLSRSQAIEVGRQAAEALAHAHARGVVHRDVKPANLLFDSRGRLRLADFGIARALAEASWTEPSGGGPGTTRYASPEQVMGRTLDGHSDVYSLALVLMESITAMVPLLADTPAGTMGLRTSREVDVSVDFGALREPLLAATALAVDERSDAARLAGALRDAAADEPAPAPLPLVARTGSGELTSEFRIHDGLAGLSVIGPLAGEALGGGLPADPPGADVVPIPLPDADSDFDDRTDDSTDGRAEDRTDAETGVGPSSHGPVDAYDPRSPQAGTRASSSPDRSAVRTSDTAPSTATATAPSRRRRRLLVVVLVLALLGVAAVAGWYLIGVPTHEVPDWVGGDVAEATAGADALGWEVAPVVEVREDGTSPGEVLAQEPSPGSILAEGEAVELTVSLGPTLTAVPDFSGRTEDEAMALISDAGLVLGERSSVFDEEVPAATLMSAALAEGSVAPDEKGRVPKGTAVDLVVSDGPAPRAVPGGLVGVPLDDASAALEAVQLVPVVTEQYSDAVAAGLTLSAAAAEGDQVPRGAQVGLVVSLGPQPITVPDVTGSSVTDATATLEGAGFTVSGVDGSPSGTVLATDPPAGEQGPRGTAVRLFTRA